MSRSAKTNRALVVSKGLVTGERGVDDRDRRRALPEEAPGGGGGVGDGVHVVGDENQGWARLDREVGGDASGQLALVEVQGVNDIRVGEHQGVRGGERPGIGSAADDPAGGVVGAGGCSDDGILVAVELERVRGDRQPGAAAQRANLVDVQGQLVGADGRDSGVDVRARGDGEEHRTSSKWIR